jgi:tetratricopeptide (TPR) repeat protein
MHSSSEQDRLLADELISRKCFTDAIRILKELVSKHPHEKSHLLALAWAYHDSGMLPETVECFEKLLDNELKRNTFTGFAYDELVRIFKQTLQYDRLVSICERAVSAQPNDITLLNEMGNAYRKAGVTKKAAETFRQLIDLEPDASVYHCLLGNVLVELGDPEGAAKAYNRAIEIDPSEIVKFMFRLGNAFMEGGHAQEAEKRFKICIEYQIEEPLYHCALGDCLVSQNKIIESIVCYENAVRIDNGSAGAYYNRLGNSLMKAGHFQQAADAFRKALMHEPRNTLYRIHLTEAYKFGNLPAEAEQALKELNHD